MSPFSMPKKYFPSAIIDIKEYHTTLIQGENMYT